jgi:hypothetical protein
MHLAQKAEEGGTVRGSFRDASCWRGKRYTFVMTMCTLMRRRRHASVLLLIRYTYLL